VLEVNAIYFILLVEGFALLALILLVWVVIALFRLRGKRRSIADLERRLGVRLVERDRGGVRPTAAGRALLRPARQVLQAERNARMAVESLAGLLSGTLVVGGSTTPSSYVVPELFRRFHAMHPGVALQMVTADSRDVIEMVRGADVEVALVGARPHTEDLHYHEMGADRIVPGHGPVTDDDGVRALRGYLVALEAEARKRYDAGLPVREAARDIALDDYASWGDAERIVVNLATLYREFGDPSPPPSPVELFAWMAELRRDRP